MEPTLAKILSRFDGNVNEAVAYCLRISIEYPRLRSEYEDYAEQLTHQYFAKDNPNLKFQYDIDNIGVTNPTKEDLIKWMQRNISKHINLVNWQIIDEDGLIYNVTPNSVTLAILDGKTIEKCIICGLTKEEHRSSNLACIDWPGQPEKGWAKISKWKPVSEVPKPKLFNVNDYKYKCWVKNAFGVVSKFVDTGVLSPFTNFHWGYIGNKAPTTVEDLYNLIDKWNGMFIHNKYTLVDSTGTVIYPIDVVDFDAPIKAFDIKNYKYKYWVKKSDDWVKKSDDSTFVDCGISEFQTHHWGYLPSKAQATSEKELRFLIDTWNKQFAHTNKYALIDAGTQIVIYPLDSGIMSMPVIECEPIVYKYQWKEVNGSNTGNFSSADNVNDEDSANKVIAGWNDTLKKIRSPLQYEVIKVPITPTNKVELTLNKKPKKAKVNPYTKAPNEYIIKEAEAAVKLWHIICKDRWKKYNYVTIALTKEDAFNKIKAHLWDVGYNEFSVDLSMDMIHEVHDRAVMVKNEVE